MRYVLIIAFLFVFSRLTLAQESLPPFEHWPVDLKIGGRIAVANQLSDLQLLGDLLKLEKAGEACLLVHDALDTSLLLERYSTAFDRISTIHVDQLPQSWPSDIPHVVAWHSQSLTHASQADAFATVRSFLAKHIAQGGTVIACGPAARQLGAHVIVNTRVHPRVEAGMNLLPDSVLCTDFTTWDQSRVCSVLASHPRCVGIGLESETALVLSGRKIRVAGKGRGTFLLMANERQPLRIELISAQSSRRQSPREWLIDLTEWRRDAIDRTLPPFPEPQTKKPCVDRGTLIIVGGGGMPPGLMEQFVEFAGGPENARLIYIPCSEEDEVAPRQSTVEDWKRMGVQQASVVHSKNRQQAHTDEQFLAPLKDATGIWFGGGRQWNFADSYYGTTAQQLMKQVLQRGGVIGGSSAGASIQARYLARATPIENFRIMAPGYERGGLGFLSGVAIDQHFSQRRRQADMTQLVNRYPQLLGIGIDEATAMIVRGSRAEIVGKGCVHFYDRNQPLYPDQPDFIALPEGSVYDLAIRKNLAD